jgi:hypothetical protein
MSVGLEGHPPMAKKGKGISVQIDDDVVKSARVVSALTDKPMSALISDILRPVLAKMEQEEIAKRSQVTQTTQATPKRKAGGK